MVLFLLASTLALLVAETGDLEKILSLSNSLDIEHVVRVKIMETVTNEPFYCVFLILQVAWLASALLQLVRLIWLIADILKKTLENELTTIYNNLNYFY